MNEYPITPVPKPRQTQRDKWLNPPRPGVARYREFKRLVKMHKVILPPSSTHVLFVLPMPKSWGKQRKKVMDGQPHEQVPDLDNLIKALNDAVRSDDSGVWDLRATKIWGYEGRFLIMDTDIVNVMVKSEQIGV